ncbi:MAG: aspartate/glutamate racemase family protein [Neisseriales bacterium]|nr:MAG: aspartate/glutamate racemase family protein [Neisseriales bacterium]
MKIIGVLGGMSWESTQSYYQIINQEVKRRLGGLHSAKCIVYSVDFAEIEQLQQNDDWESSALILSNAAQALQLAGAELIVIATNTMHKVFDEIQKSVAIPLLHIADATVAQIKLSGINKIALLGTCFTMEQDFYKARLSDNYGIEVVVPNREERKIVHDIIYDELCKGIISENSRQYYLDLIKRLVASGADGIILGCTEIEQLVNQIDCNVPLFATARIHALAAVDFALSDI